MIVSTTYQLEILSKNMYIIHFGAMLNISITIQKLKTIVLGLKMRTSFQ